MTSKTVLAALAVISPAAAPPAVTAERARAEPPEVLKAAVFEDFVSAPE